LTITELAKKMLSVECFYKNCSVDYLKSLCGTMLDLRLYLLAREELNGSCLMILKLLVQLKSQCSKTSSMKIQEKSKKFLKKVEFSGFKSSISFQKLVVLAAVTGEPNFIYFDLVVCFLFLNDMNNF